MNRFLKIASSIEGCLLAAIGAIGVVLCLWAMFSPSPETAYFGALPGLGCIAITLLAYMYLWNIDAAIEHMELLAGLEEESRLRMAREEHDMWTKYFQQIRSRLLSI